EADVDVRIRVDAHLSAHVRRERADRLEVDAGAGLVSDLDGHERPPELPVHRSYASTIADTSACLTTSLLVSVQNAMSSTFSRIPCTTRSPLEVPCGRS